MATKIEERVSQAGETPAQTGQAASFAYRYAYARSADTRAANDRGQDYLTFRSGDGAFVFALCDGVSQSFFGDLAAVFLGDALVEWLKRAPDASLDGEAARGSLADYLRGLTSAATEIVRRHSLPSTIIPLMRHVLEQKRAGGSESTFVCGRIDRPSRTLPEGRLLLAWMGDSRLRLWRAQGESTGELGDTFHTRERWSSLRGPVSSEPHVFVSTLGRGPTQCVGLMAYSDGLTSLDGCSTSPSTFMLQDLIDRAGESATSDDISFLEIWLDGVPASASVTPVAPAQLVSVRLEGDRILAAWRSLPKVRRYQIELRGRKTEAWETTGVSWASPGLEPASYQVRVRGLNGTEPGQWSRPEQVTVPVPMEIPAPMPDPPRAGARPTLRPAPLPAGYSAPPAYPYRHTAEASSRPRPLLAIVIACLLCGLSFLAGVLVTRIFTVSGSKSTQNPAVAQAEQSAAKPAVVPATAPALAAGTGCPNISPSPSPNPAQPGWTCRNPSARPLARQSAAMASGTKGMVLLFGGKSGSTYLNDTWEWNGNTWRQVKDTRSVPAPPVRHSAAMAKGADDIVVLFGGTQDADRPLGDTWTWDGTSWTPHPPSGGLPPRYGAAMAQDPKESVVLFGGVDGSGALADTWVWTGRIWVRQRLPDPKAAAPDPRGFAGMAYDRRNQRVLMFGGLGDKRDWLQDTWSWEQDEWRKLETVGQPTALRNPYMVYDANLALIVLMGLNGSGPDSQFETWLLLDGKTWTRRPVASGAPKRDLPGIAADPASGILLFGGADISGRPVDETWILSISSGPEASLPASGTTRATTTPPATATPARTATPGPSPAR